MYSLINIITKIILTFCTFSQREKADVGRELDRAKLKLDALDNEKEQLEHIKQSLTSQVFELNSENENLQRQILNLKKTVEGFHEEKENLMLNRDDHKKNLEIW